MEILTDWKNGHTRQAIAAKYGADLQTVTKVVFAKSWDEIMHVFGVLDSHKK